MTQRKKTWFTTQRMTTIAILTAVASILFALDFSVIPAVPFYKMDFSKLPVLLGTFSMGPFAGMLILLLKALIGLTHTTSSGVGEIADFLVGLAMVLPAGWIYTKRKTRGGAILGMAAGTVLATLVALPINVYILFPFFHVPAEALVAMGQKILPPITSLWEFVLLITAPFNLFKWVVLSILGTLMYKPLSPVLHGRRKGVGASAGEREKV